MMPLRRAAPPAFWADAEKEWLARVDAAESGEKKLPPAPLRWTREEKTLARHFLASVRAGGSLHLCAYCDGALGETSPATIDHFFPQDPFHRLVLCWTNLYPACVQCNSTHKGTRWSCHLLRPDADLTGTDDLDAFSKMFLFDPDSGRLLPAPGLDRETLRRVRLTLRVFGLNTEERRGARRRAWKDALNAVRRADEDTLVDKVRSGPYRFIVLELLRQRAER